ncbi:MAG: ATP-binding cassette domain-containing protein [Defluviitaleaceae bacterium]|nr:ATP-binding cassette domain-containing protein [Defluviitaleaceae bacterium]
MQISVTNLTFAYDGSYDNIFENVSFQLDTDWKLGFTGRNGRGKTTFLNLLLGKYEYSGNISASVTFEYFPYPVASKNANTRDVLAASCEAFEEWRLLREMSLLEISPEVLDRPFSSLSNGEQTKILLAALFLNENNFLLIDEPTNHLDTLGRRLVSRYLAGKKGFILVSHDRAFLDGCIDRILSINRANIEVRRGNFSSWLADKERRDSFELAENAKLKKEIKRLQTAAQQSSRFADKAETAKMGKGAAAARKKGHAGIGSKEYQAEKSRKMQQRRKNLERRQDSAVEEKSALLKNLDRADSLKIAQLPLHTSRFAEFRNVSIFYTDAPVCRDVNFTIERGDRIALCGKNGSGKSSILKLLGGEAARSREHVSATAHSLEAVNSPARSREHVSAATHSLEAVNSPARSREHMPAAAHSLEAVNSPLTYSGELAKASGLKISYVSQDTSFLSGNLSDFAAAHDIDESLFKAILRKLDFSRVQLEKNMRDFSGGQKKKTLLAKSLCEKAHLLIWDEPLNFVDVLSRMQIEQLLLEHAPTILFVEHDRIFCEKIATKSVFL